MGELIAFLSAWSVLHTTLVGLFVLTLRAGGRVCLLEASELIDFTNKTECRQNYLHVQSPTDPLVLRNIVAGGSC